MSTKYTFEELLQSLRAGRDVQVGRPSVSGDEIRWPQRFGGHHRPPQTAEIWREVQTQRDTCGPSLSPIGIGMSATTCTPHQWDHLLSCVSGRRSLDEAYEGPTFGDMLAGTPGHPFPWQTAAHGTHTSPAYGPAGKPSPGRMVRFHAEFGDTPAVIHCVADESTGQCVLCLDIVAPAHLPGRFTQVTRVATLASFGSDVGQWDYWPRV